MLNIFLYISGFFLFLIFFVIFLLFILWIVDNFRNQVPFIMTPRSVLKDIEKALEIKDDSVVYDLGSGDGRVLIFLSKIKPKAKYIGIENGIFPFLLSKIEIYFKKEQSNPKINILKKDFFEHDLSDATHIFIYLYPNVMDDLLPKFDRELKKGTRLVSLSFQFTNKRPSLEIDLNRNKYKLGRKLYVYDF